MRHHEHTKNPSTGDCKSRALFGLGDGMSEYYIAVDPKTLACIEIGVAAGHRLEALIDAELVVFPVTKANASKLYGSVFESLDHAYREASKQ